MALRRFGYGEISVSYKVLDIVGLGVYEIVDFCVLRLLSCD